MGDSPENDAMLYMNMRAMISLVDKLRDFNLDDYIALPRITVLGEQSAGKSSLLEGVCGLNFLPRGSGIVTRRPLELRMVRSNVPSPYFIFPKDFGTDKKFFNPDEVRRTIESLTSKVAGDEKTISDDPIICTVYSSTVPDLTLVDLPGITRIAIGNQPKNIEEITKNLVRKYCDDPNSLILCVVPANIDLSTSDALNFAKQLDPKGGRTLGVLTKIDLMDEGTDAVSVLLNKEVPLHYGYVGVKGRSQKEVKENLTVHEAIQRELDFFGKHPVYSTLPSELLGTRSLIDRMSKILFDMIKNSLPRIKSEIIERKRKAKEQLEILGEDFPDSEEKKLEMVFKLVRSFKETYDQEITGKYFHEKASKKNDKDLQRKRHAETITFQLNKLFNELYEEYTEKDFKISKGYSDENIRYAIDVYQGESIPGFHSFDSFLYLINPKLELLKSPIYHVLDEAKNILETKGMEILDFIFKKFPRLLGEVKETFQKYLNQIKNTSRKILENLISCEENYIFTNDSLMFENPFIDPKKKMANVRDLLVEELRKRIDNYFFIVVRNMKDVVPKIIGHFLLRKFSEGLEVEILNSLNKKSYCLDTFNENKVTTSTRAKLKHELQALSNAESLLVNEFQMGFNLKSEIETEKSTSKSVERQVNVDFGEDYFEDIDGLNEEFLRFNAFLLRNNGGLGSTGASNYQSAQPNQSRFQTNISTSERPSLHPEQGRTQPQQNVNPAPNLNVRGTMNPAQGPNQSQTTGNNPAQGQGFRMQQMVHDDKQHNQPNPHQQNVQPRPSPSNVNINFGQNQPQPGQQPPPQQQRPTLNPNQPTQQNPTQNQQNKSVNPIKPPGFNPGPSPPVNQPPRKNDPWDLNLLGYGAQQQAQPQPSQQPSNRNVSPNVQPPKPNVPPPPKPVNKNNLFGDPGLF
jgi:replication fork clamp-binding protein CrfC